MLSRPQLEPVYRTLVSDDDPRKALASGEHSVKKSFLEKAICLFLAVARISVAFKLKRARGRNMVDLEKRLKMPDFRLRRYSSPCKLPTVQFLVDADKNSI